MQSHVDFEGLVGHENLKEGVEVLDTDIWSTYVGKLNETPTTYESYKKSGMNIALSIV